MGLVGEALTRKSLSKAGFRPSLSRAWLHLCCAPCSVLFCVLTSSSGCFALWSWDGCLLEPGPLGKESPVCHILIDLGNCVLLISHWGCEEDAGLTGMCEPGLSEFWNIPPSWQPHSRQAVVPQKNIWVLLGRGRGLKLCDRPGTF